MTVDQQVLGFNVLDLNYFHNLYISKNYPFYEHIWFSFVVLMKELATFLTCYAKAHNVRRPESKPHVPCYNSSTAVQTTSQ